MSRHHWGRTALGIVTPDEAAAPARMAEVAYQSDTQDLVDISHVADSYKSLYIGSAGHVAVIPLHSQTEQQVVFKNVQSGTVLEVAVRRVFINGTTAKDIVGLIG